MNLATEALYEVQATFPEKPPDLIPLPTCHAYLLHKGVHQTSQELHVLRTGICQPELQDYLCERNNWSMETLNTVDWTAYARAIKKLDWSKRVYAIKFSHRWLPTAVRLARYKDVTVGNGCHLCGQPETDNHVFQCPQRNQWKTKFLAALRCHLEKWRTAADIRSLIIHNLSEWLHNNTDMRASPQDAIGWACFFRGYIATDLTKAQSRFYQMQELDRKKFNGTLWAQRLIEFTWTHTQAVWKSRSQQVHDRDDSQRIARDHQEALNRTRAMYAVREDLLADDRALLDVPLSERLQQRPASLIDWANNTYGVIQHCMKEAKETALTGCRDLRNYFQRKQPNNNRRRRSASTRNTATQTTNKKPRSFRMTTVTEFFKRRQSNASSVDPVLPTQRKPPDPVPKNRAQTTTRTQHHSRTHHNQF